MAIYGILTFSGKKCTVTAKKREVRRWKKSPPLLEKGHNGSKFK
jgi:hypothetical protein